MGLIALAVYFFWFWFFWRINRQWSDYCKELIHEFGKQLLQDLHSIHVRDRALLRQKFRIRVIKIYLRAYMDVYGSEFMEYMKAKQKEPFVDH